MLVFVTALIKFLKYWIHVQMNRQIYLIKQNKMKLQNQVIKTRFGHHYTFLFCRWGHCSEQDLPKQYLQAGGGIQEPWTQKSRPGSTTADRGRVCETDSTSRIRILMREAEGMLLLFVKKKLRSSFSWYSKRWWFKRFQNCLFG